MSHHRLHLHSMMVHAVAALIPLAAATWIAETTALRIGRFDTSLWVFLTRTALAAALVVAIPSTITGISERGHMYARWHGTHRIKLVLSLVLIGLIVGELWLLVGGGARWPLLSWPGLLIVGANNLVAILLGAYGFKISLGRQAFGRTSYVSDMDRDPPLDILQVDADFVAEPAKIVEPHLEEGSSA